MGRKKIDISYIQGKKERSVTFCKRKVGLLKKACEIGMLCGVDVILAFTDLTRNIHIYHNTDYLKINYQKSLL
jgi:transcription factor RLM1